MKLKLTIVAVALSFSSFAMAHEQGSNASAGAGASANAGAVAGASAGVKNNVRNTNTNANINANQNRNSASANNRNTVNGSQQGQSLDDHSNQSQFATGLLNSNIGGGSASATGGGNGANQQAVNVNSDYRATAESAYAPAIMPTAPCMGSSSVGGQGMSFGVSFGTTWKDEGCDFRENIRTVATVLNDPVTAQELMCSKQDYREARERAGRPCAPVKKETVAANAPTQTASREESYQGNDPIVRSRLGLAPLSK